MERSLAFHLSRNFLQEKYHQVLDLAVKWQLDHHSVATINRVRKAYDDLRDFFDRGFMYINAITKFIISVGAMMYFIPFYGSIALVLGILNIMIIRKFDRPFVRALDEVNEKEHVVSATLFDSLSNIMTVITLRLERSMETGLMTKVRQIFRPFRRSAVINEWKWFCAEMMIVSIYGLIAFGYVYQHWSPEKVFNIGGLATLLLYVNQFTSVFQDIAWQYTEIIQYNTYVKTADVISEAYADQHRADRPDGLPDNWNAITLRRLNFSHQPTYDAGQHAQSLHDLHLTIRRGRRIALIGESGSGKTTVLSLLRGLYQPEPGLEIDVETTPSRPTNLHDPSTPAIPATSNSPADPKTWLDRLNEAVTLFPQEPEIFENTIAYNITLGLPFSEAEIMEVCEKRSFYRGHHTPAPRPRIRYPRKRGEPLRRPETTPRPRPRHPRRPRQQRRPARRTHQQRRPPHGSHDLRWPLHRLQRQSHHFLHPSPPSTTAIRLYLCFAPGSDNRRRKL